MAYRLMCIYETPDNQTTPDLRIEVCLDGKSQTIAPFQRKVSLSDLYNEGVTAGAALLPLLNHAGLEHQPFRINPRFLQSSAVVGALRNHPYSFIQPNAKASVKKSPCPITQGSAYKYPLGTLIGGELYIDHPASWHRNIKVRLRYQNTPSAFYPSYSPIPFITPNGQMMQRDESAESKLLQTLGISYDPTSFTLSLPNSDTTALEALTHQGWHVYIVNPHPSRLARLYRQSAEISQPDICP